MSEPFVRACVLRGWASRSSWGYDPVLECYWACLWRPGQPPGDPPAVRIGPEHLVATVAGLARAVAFAAEVADAEVYLALTA